MNTTRHTPTEPLREADVSITLKGLVRNADAMVTLRGRDLETVLQKCARALAWIENPVALPPEERHAGHGAAYGNGHGNGHANGHQHDGDPQGHTPHAPPLSEPYVCEQHGAPLKRYSKGAQTWYSHRLPDGTWCRGA